MNRRVRLAKRAQNPPVPTEMSRLCLVVLGLSVLGQAVMNGRPADDVTGSHRVDDLTISQRPAADITIGHHRAVEDEKRPHAGGVMRALATSGLKSEETLDGISAAGEILVGATQVDEVQVVEINGVNATTSWGGVIESGLKNEFEVHASPIRAGTA